MGVHLPVYRLAARRLAGQELGFVDGHGHDAHKGPHPCGAVLAVLLRLAQLPLGKVPWVTDGPVDLAGGLLAQLVHALGKADKAVRDGLGNPAGGDRHGLGADFLPYGPHVLADAYRRVPRNTLAMFHRSTFLFRMSAERCQGDPSLPACFPKRRGRRYG